jgi:hypothetical protein
MSDTLTASERAAIAAFPAERIYRAKPGETGLPLEPGHWMEQRKGDYRQKQRRAKFRKSAESARIDAQIRSYRDMGLTYRDISERMDMGERAVWARAARMGLTGGDNG